VLPLPEVTTGLNVTRDALGVNRCDAATDALLVELLVAIGVAGGAS